MRVSVSKNQSRDIRFLYTEVACGDANAMSGLKLDIFGGVWSK